MVDSLGSRLSFYGRVTDDLRREPAWQGEYRVTLKAPAREALYKRDGHFTFLDLRPSATAYDFRLVDGLYQGRDFTKPLPTTAPVELAFDGEDEIHVFAKVVNAASKQFTFDAIPFLPVLKKGSVVLGEGGFSSVLDEDLGGVDVTTAVLASVAGLTAGDLVRIVRSQCLRAKPGPYYPFPSGTTLLLLRAVEDTAEELPLAGVKAHLTRLNGAIPSSTPVGGVVLHHLVLGALRPVLGTDADLDAFTEARGNAVFYFPGFWPVTSVQMDVSAVGFAPQTLVVPVVAGRTTSAKVKLVSL